MGEARLDIGNELSINMRPYDKSHIITHNWIPESHSEFRSMYRADRVRLNMEPHHYTWGRSKIRSFFPLVGERLRMQLLSRMEFYEDFFKEAHRSIDLILLKEWSR